MTVEGTNIFIYKYGIHKKVNFKVFNFSGSENTCLFSFESKNVLTIFTRVSLVGPNFQKLAKL